MNKPLDFILVVLKLICLANLLRDSTPAWLSLDYILGIERYYGLIIASSIF